MREGRQVRKGDREGREANLPLRTVCFFQMLARSSASGCNSFEGSCSRPLSLDQGEKSCLAGQAPHATLGPSQQSRDWAALFRQLTQPCSGRSLPPLCCRCVYLKSKRPEKTESKIRSRGVYYCPYRKLFTFTAATNAGPIPLLR